MSLFSELKRRNVFRVGATYAVVAWVLMQVADIVLPAFNAPQWVLQVFLFFLALGFPVALVLSWAFELTPDGIKKAADVDPAPDSRHQTREKLNYVFIGSVVILLVLFVVDMAGYWVVNDSPVPDELGEASTATTTLTLLPLTLVANASPDQARRIGDALRTQLVQARVAVSSPSATVESMADYFLRGSLDGTGEDAVISLHLDDRARGVTVWSDTRKASDSGMAEAHFFTASLRCAQEWQSTGASKEQFPLYLAACGKIVALDYGGLLREAERIYQESPNDVNATALLALAHFSQSSPNSAQQAQYYAELAESLAPDHPRVLIARVGGLDPSAYAAREALLREAMSAGLTVPQVRFGLATVLWDVGRINESIEETYRYLPDFMAGPLAWRTARLLAASGEWREANRLYDQVQPIDPEETDRHRLLTEVWYAEPSAAEERLAASIEPLQLQPNETSCLSAIINGRRGLAVDIAQFKVDCARFGSGVEPRNLMLVGDTEGAMASLERFAEQPGSTGGMLFYSEMKPLWADPRFWRAAARMKLVDYWLESGIWPDLCAAPDVGFDCRVMASAALAELGDSGEAPAI